jgi:hypothetical protein
VRLQSFADEVGLTISVTHYPTGASKWNPIEHRMFNLISANWRGQPLESQRTPRRAGGLLGWAVSKTASCG